VSVTFSATQYVDSYLRCDVCQDDIASEDIDTGYPLFEQTDSEIQDFVVEYWINNYDHYDDNTDRFFCESCWHAQFEPDAPGPHRVEWVRANQEALLLDWQQKATNYRTETEANNGR
jgi:hypothetical protein